MKGIADGAEVSLDQVMHQIKIILTKICGFFFEAFKYGSAHRVL